MNKNSVNYHLSHRVLGNALPKLPKSYSKKVCAAESFTRTPAYVCVREFVFNSPLMCVCYWCNAARHRTSGPKWHNFLKNSNQFVCVCWFGLAMFAKIHRKVHLLVIVSDRVLLSLQRRPWKVKTELGRRKWKSEKKTSHKHPDIQRFSHLFSYRSRTKHSLHPGKTYLLSTCLQIPMIKSHNYSFSTPVVGRPETMSMQ